MNFLLHYKTAGYHAGRLGSCLGLVLVICALQSAALVPEPYALYYGQAKGPDGDVLIREAGAEVLVKINGQENTRYRVGDAVAENVNYIVRVKVDDGIGYLYDPTAARAGDVPEFVIRSEGIDYGVEDILPPVGERGEAHSVDIEAVPEPGTAVFALAGMLFLVRVYRANRK